ncbi:Flagellar hook-associated protein 3 [Anatilimnocola aggregata]|uniref:Flagellar hook-associated protein 3 n=1 Tax=Anatilimnocola aggregata TaxID=2528021 RepID=A0A517YKV1_9BACT|nr:flagellar hook-associated protein FlgL [Anatilimnocola aggregata]QDU30849.1 Flagellar hook-associated protein 3 [Anatilimnocola aggregata]
MAAIYPIPTTRVSEALTHSRMLSQLQSDEVSILRLQQQIATGRRIFQPSDDAPAAQRAISLQRLLEQKAQARENLSTSQSYLSATDTAVQGITNTLNAVRSEVLGVTDSVSSEAAREAAIQQVQLAIEQLADVGNQVFRGRYLFAGSRTTTQPFQLTGNQVSYLGNESQLQSYSDVDLLFSTNLPGSDIFGGFSNEVHGTIDLNPVATRETLLTDLHGGRGITKGSIAISDGTSTKIIDFAGAETLGDVADLINANAPTGRTVSARITNNGLVLDIDDAGGGNFTIREVGGGTTAAELGIYQPTGVLTGAITGADLNPRLRPTTSLNAVFGSRARTVLESPGLNNNIVIESLTRGTANNGVTVQLVDDALLDAGPGLIAGFETATYSAAPVAARAGLTFNGFGNNLQLTGNVTGTSLNNVQIQVVDAGAIGANATATFNSTTKTLTIGIDSAGGTEIQNVIAAINGEGTFTAAYDAANPADGGYNPTATIPAGDAGLVTGNTGNSGGDANTIFVNVQRNATTANQVLVALQGNAAIQAQFSTTLEQQDSTGAGSAGSGGVDLNATAVTSGGSGFEPDLASGLRIVNGNNTYNVSFAGAQSVQDILNTLNGSGAGVLAEINAAGDGLVIRSHVSGYDFSIGENGGNTATQLGVRSLTAATDLANLNYGRGVTSIAGTDFTIVRNDGVPLEIDVSSATNMQQVLDLINNHASNQVPGAQVTARLAQFGNGIELVDSTVGAGSLHIVRATGSNAATELGLIPQGANQSLPAVVSGPNTVLTGVDANPQEVSGVFNSLLRIKDALVNFDLGKLERSVELLDADMDKILFARSELGARAQGLDTLDARLEDEDVELQAALSNEIEVDWTAAISTLAARQASLQASLQLTAQAFQLSLLNYL